MSTRTTLGFIGSALVASMLAFPLVGSAADTTTVLCNDGTTATHTGKGACSHHGGVNKSGTASAGSSSSSTGGGGAGGTSSSMGSPADTSAGTVLCNDGTTSTRTGKGACSHHGGVNKSGTA